VAELPHNPWLIVAGVLSAAAGLLHLAIIAGGPDWYRFFGAGEHMARMAELGLLRPALITAGVAGMLAIWAAYAFAGAGLIPRLPLMRTALVAITILYMLRALVVIPLLALGQASLFLIWSSLIVLVCGLAYAAGTWRAWSALSARAR
jgi:hypothetical protein